MRRKGKKEARTISARGGGLHNNQRSLLEETLVPQCIGRCLSATVWRRLKIEKTAWKRQQTEQLIYFSGKAEC